MKMKMMIAHVTRNLTVAQAHQLLDVSPVTRRALNGLDQNADFQSQWTRLPRDVQIELNECNMKA
jgi:hypothetical protein